MKPKLNYKPSTMDCCQTPPYAVQILIPFLKPDWIIWESASGEGYIVDTLQRSGFKVVAGDVQTGQDYFLYEPEWYDWIKRAYQLGKPFALLMQTETIGVWDAMKQFSLHGVEIIQPSKRIDYKMPNKGWDSNAQMPSAWFTWGLGIGNGLTFVSITKYKPQSIPQPVTVIDSTFCQLRF